MKKILAILFCICLINSVCNASLTRRNSFDPQEHATKIKRGFCENKGQIRDLNNNFNPAVLYSFATNGLNIGIRKNGFSYDAWKAENKNVKNGIINFHRVDIDFLGANVNAQIITEGKSADQLIYHTYGAPEEGWTVHHYSRIICKELYPGIDLEYIANSPDEQAFEYNFILKPGADPKLISMRYNGAEALKLIKGHISISLSLGTITEHIPKSWLEEVQKEVTIGYRIIEEDENSVTIGFKGDYDKNRTLIIDPTPKLNWSTYYGGTDGDGAYGVCADHNGNVFMCGATYSLSGIATSGGYKNSKRRGYADMFVAKFNNSGALQWGTYYGDTMDEYAYAITTDKNDNVYFCGYSEKSTGLASSGAHQTTNNGGYSDALIVKLSNSGARLWATYYGGFDEDIAYSVCTDDSGYVYMTGSTKSYTSIASAGAHRVGLDYIDAFLVKFSSSGTRIWGTYYGGFISEFGKSVCTDKNYNVYVAGYTYSKNGIATAGAHQDTLNYEQDAFLVKFNSNGKRQWGTYYGGYRADEGLGVRVDDSSNVFLTGTTVSSYGISTTGAHQTTFSSPALSNYNDVFLVKFNSTGKRLWGTYYGGYFDEVLQSIFIDSSNNVYLSGVSTSSSGLTTKGAFQIKNRGLNDGFLAKFSNNGVQQWGTYFGGSSYEPVCVSNIGYDETIYLTGLTQSDSNIASPGAYKIVYKDTLSLKGDAFLVSFKGCNTPEEINVKGNNITIDDGNSIIAYTDSTYFGPASGNTTRSFTIENTGTDTLFIDTVKFTGANPSYFKASNVPAFILPSASKKIYITFTPYDIGIMNATVQIINSDCDESEYTFQLRAGTKLGQTLNFDGSNDYVTLPSTLPGYFNSGKVSVEIWINSNQPAAYYPAIIKNWGTNTYGAFQLGFEASTGKLSASIAQSDSVVKTVTGTTVLTANKWYHAAFVADGNKLHLYLNGNEEGTAMAYNGTLKTNFTRTNVGAKPGDKTALNTTIPGLWNGELDELRIWNTALSCEQIRAKMKHLIKGNESGLLAYYNFNQGFTSGNNTGTTSLKDSSKNALQGTLNTFAMNGNTSNFIEPGCPAQGFTADPQTEISIKGNNHIIVNDDNTPSITDSTYFGATASGILRSFLIENKGNDSLRISGINISGPDAANFTTASIKKVLAPGDSVRFFVHFNSSGSGSKSAIITVLNNDCDEGNYNFTVKGAGVKGETLTFDGDDDYITLPSAVSGRFNNGIISGEMWFNSANPKANMLSLIKNWGTTVSGAFQIGMDGTTGKLKVSIAQADSNVKSVTSSAIINANSWYHVAFVADGKYLRLYLNGNETGTPAAYNGTLKTNFNRTNIGALPGNNVEVSLLNPGYWNGKIDELRLWNTARTCDQIKAFMNHELKGNEAGLVAYYNFNQGSDGGNNQVIKQLLDSSSNNFHALLNYFILTGTTSNFTQPGCGVFDKSFDPQPEISIKGNSLEINAGDKTPSVSDSTDFGVAFGMVTRSFVIENPGSDTLRLTGISVSGNQASEFKPTIIPAYLAPGKQHRYTVTFTPQDTGLRNAIISINSNDCDESPYVFYIQGFKKDTSHNSNLKTTFSIHKNISVYPNPANSEITISVTDATVPFELTIFASDGKSVLQKSCERSTRTIADIGHLAEGVYIIKVTYNGNSYLQQLLIAR